MGKTCPPYGWRWANSTLHQRSYDLNGRLTYLQHGSDYSKSYSWDDANRAHGVASNIPTLL